MRPIMLQVKSYQKTMGEDPVEIDFVTEGKLYHKNQAMYLVYEETELSGLPGHTTTLKITDEAIRMRRYGQSETTMTFKKGVREVTDYETPYGVFKLEFLTHKIIKDLGETEGYVDIEYSLAIQGMHEANHKLHVRYW